MNNNKKVFIHADDYGMTEESCMRIEECIRHGCLNSISIMPNGCLSFAAERLKTYHVDMVLHLNLVEGKSISQKEDVSLLVRPDGNFKNSFFGLLLLSLSFKRDEFKRQVKLEFRNQIRRYMEYFPEGKSIKIDSHQHFHMIPLIFASLMEVIAEEGLSVDYLRIPVEPILPFIKHPSLLCTVKIINIIKVLVLDFCWLFDKPCIASHKIPSAIFCGILFSGKMDLNRVNLVFPDFYRLAKKQDKNIELLFHPGYIKIDEPFMDPAKSSFNKFYLSDGRRTEHDTLCSSKLKCINYSDY